jgi:hypothetical protein
MWKFAVACLLGVLFAAPAASVSDNPFDGKWIGTAPDAGDCGVLTLSITVYNGWINGTVKGSHGVPKIEPTQIGSDGTAQVSYYKFKGTLKLLGIILAGTFDSFCGLRTVAGAKQP